MSNIYYGFGRIFTGKEYDFCMSHYRARYKSEEISPFSRLLWRKKTSLHLRAENNTLQASNSLASRMIFRYCCFLLQTLCIEFDTETSTIGDKIFSDPIFILISSSESNIQHLSIWSNIDLISEMQKHQLIRYHLKYTPRSWCWHRNSLENFAHWV